MTPMTLERTLEVAIASLRAHAADRPHRTAAKEWCEAAAVLREFKDKGLPVYTTLVDVGIVGTPDLTEALARLKALEEAIGRYGRYPGIEPCDEWADEIAAIRNLLERKES